MTPKERVLATIRGEAVDRIPVYHLSFSGHAASVILGRENVCVGGACLQWLEMKALWEGEDAHREFEKRCREDAVAIAEACGHDMLRLGYWRWRETPSGRIDENTFLFGDPEGDRYTMTYLPDVELFTREDGDAGGGRSVPRDAGETELSEEELLRQVVETEERAGSYSPPAGPDPQLKAAIERYPDYLVRHGAGTVYVSMKSTSELMAVAYWPELFARKLMARAQLSAKDMPAMSAAGLDVNVTGMDFCSKQGPSISPSTFREVVAPALKVIVDACHEHGMYYFYASDGNFWPVAEDMFNVVGVDGWVETDKSAGMDLRELRERFPNVTIQGNIRVQVLHRGTREEVVREVMDCLEVAHELGGVIVGASNLIMPGTPPENIAAMLETIEKNR